MTPPTARIPLLRDAAFHLGLARAQRAIRRGRMAEVFATLLALAPLAGDPAQPPRYGRKLGRALAPIAAASSDPGLAAACSALLRARAEADPERFLSTASPFQPWIAVEDWPAALRRRLHDAARADPGGDRAAFGTLFATNRRQRAALLQAWLDRHGAPATVTIGTGAIPLAFAAPSRAEEGEGPLVSVVMTCFQAEATLQAAIASVLAQSWRRLELLVVDDASRDGSWRIIREAAARDQRVRGIRLAANGGTYRAKNIGLGETRGSVVTFHDSDDVSHPDKIAAQLRALAAGVAGTLSGWLRVDADGVCVPARTGRYLRRNYSSLMLRRETLDALGRFDAVRVSADSEFIDRLRRRFGRGALVESDLPLALGFIRPSALTRTAETLQSEYATSPLREDYARAYRAWHRAAAREALCLPYPCPSRPFPAPAALLAGAADDTIAETA